MFEKYLLDKKLRMIMMTTIEVGQINQVLIKQKIALYKSLSKSPNQGEIINKTLSVIQKQDEILRTIKILIVNSQFNQGLKLTPT